VVADSSRIFAGQEEMEQEGLLGMKQEVPLLCTSLKEHKRQDPLCKDLVEALKRGDPTATKFRLHNNLLCYQTKGAKIGLYVAQAIFAHYIVEIRLCLSYVRAFGIA
jgi:hypothetical protein